MKRIVEVILYLLIRSSLFLRYRIRVKGKEHLTANNLPKKGGILFLANHPAEIDPLILLSVLWFPFKPHPLAIDYLFRKPIIGPLLNFVGALPVPNFDTSSNSYKRREMERTYVNIYAHIDNRENILIYPAGSLKNAGHEVIGGASGVHTILEAKPEVNVVLVRSTGLWGSSFSRAPTGKTPDLFVAFFNGFKVLLRNFIFFAPRREVCVELTSAPADFPWKVDRLELNRYLERWYNAEGPEPLKLVSFSCFRPSDYPAIKEKSMEEVLSVELVPDAIKQRVMEEIARISRIPPEKITVESHLAQDLGLDSLDIAQLVVSLKENFGITSLHSSDLTTVASVLVFAAQLKTGKEEEEEKENRTGMWESEHNRPSALYPEGESIPEIFLKTCDRMDKHIACVDQVAGAVSYARLKMGVLLLAEAIRKMPGERVGIMMPASVGVNAMVLATIFAGKIPVMINWTLGERNLASIVQQTDLQTTLSSRQFIDRLENVELNGIDDKIIPIEDLRRSFSIADKLRAYYRSHKKAHALLKTLGIHQLKGQDTAAILFTSGTESYPKGVPLTHANLIANQRGAYHLAEVDSADILLGVLPPFHSFGFSVTGLFPLLVGLRVAYSPNPTDGRRVAEAVARWNVTLLCLAPTFLKNLLRVSTEQQLHSLRLVVAGAEKTASDLYARLRELNAKALLIEGYGITECAPILTINPPGKPTQGVGTPLPNVEVKVVHPETLEALPVGKQGLILARGPNVFGGYLDPHLSSPFVEIEGKKWYQTGDLGYLDERNYLTLSGRLKRFVKIGGEMVSLTSIEETLQQAGPKRGWQISHDLPSLAVCALELEGQKSEMHLFTLFETTPNEVNQILRESGMSNIIKIRTVHRVPFIPLLGTGKIDYRALSSKL